MSEEGNIEAEGVAENPARLGRWREMPISGWMEAKIRTMLPLRADDDSKC